MLVVPLLVKIVSFVFTVRISLLLWRRDHGRGAGRGSQGWERHKPRLPEAARGLVAKGRMQLVA